MQEAAARRSGISPNQQLADRLDAFAYAFKHWYLYGIGLFLIWAIVSYNFSTPPAPAKPAATKSETPPAQSPAPTRNKSAEEIGRDFNKGFSKRDNSLSTQIERDFAGRPEPLPLPENGKRFMYIRAERIAPLSMMTRESSNHFFVMLEDWDTKTPIMGIFIRAGHSIKIKVPLGNFRLKYATGTQWFGDAKESLFGPETATYQADKRFDFDQTGNQISGYTVELFLQPHGNLHTARINRRDW